jgi:hypothetical protein
MHPVASGNGREGKEIRIERDLEIIMAHLAFVWKGLVESSYEQRIA